MPKVKDNLSAVKRLNTQAVKVADLRVSLPSVSVTNAITDALKKLSPTAFTLNSMSDNNLLPALNLSNALTNAHTDIIITSASDIGSLVRTTRENMKLNQQRFADLAGVGRRFISELENGKATLEFEKVLRVCAAAGINIFAKHRSSK